MALTKDKALKTLGAIKHILKRAPQEGRLLACPSLCRPILEYADTVKPNIRGGESVTEACSELGLQPLKQRRRNHRLSLVMKVLQDEERHLTLSVASDEITGDHQ